MVIYSYMLLFTICSFAGWVFESAFAVVKTGKWERRGFLYGPVCPIYGVGVVSIVLAAKAIGRIAGMEYDWQQVFFVSFFGSMVLEYATSWAMEKLFHAYWWDYSNMPLNINGRTCVPAACLFGAGGIFALYAVYPAWQDVVAAVPGIALEVAALVVIVLITVDATLTVSALTDFQAQVAAIDETFHARAGELTERAMSVTPDVGEIIAAEREKLERTRGAQLLESMNGLRASALKRVEGFRGIERPEMLERLTRTLQDLKARRR